MPAKTRSIEMYIGRVSPRDWYTLDVDIPADTPEDKIAEVAKQELEHLLNAAKVHAAFFGVYSVSPLEEEED